MKRFCGWSTLVIACGVAGLADGRAPLIDPPSPPPCAADGTCYPNTGGWGYYQARWRTWPGTQLEPTPAKTSGTSGREGQEVSEELSHTEPPPADLEDAAAPPASSRREEPKEGPPAEGEQPAAEGGESAPPNVPLPDAEASPFGSRGDQDPPPALPRSLSATSRNAVPRAAAATTGALPAPSRVAAPAQSRMSTPAASRVSTSDPAPAPPWAQSAAL
jgi:hypothetical protein